MSVDYNPNVPLPPPPPADILDLLESLDPNNINIELEDFFPANGDGRDTVQSYLDAVEDLRRQIADAESQLLTIEDDFQQIESKLAANQQQIDQYYEQTLPPPIPPLTDGVGYGQLNNPLDVLRVQKYLAEALDRNITLDGIVGSQTNQAILDFQTGVMGETNPSGNIQPGDATWDALNKYAPINILPNDPLNVPGHIMRSMYFLLESNGGDTDISLDLTNPTVKEAIPKKYRDNIVIEDHNGDIIGISPLKNDMDELIDDLDYLYRRNRAAYNEIMDGIRSGSYTNSDFNMLPTIIDDLVRRTKAQYLHHIFDPEIVGEMLFLSTETITFIHTALRLRHIFKARRAAKTLWQRIGGAVGKRKEKLLEKYIKLKKRLLKASKKFNLTYTTAELKQIYKKAADLGLDDDIALDFIYIGSRKNKPLSANQVMQEMDNFKNVVSARGYPYKFNSLQDFMQFSRDVKNKLDNLDIPTNDVRVQGSAVRKANPDDLDMAIMVDDSQFDELLKKAFGGKVKIKQGNQSTNIPIQNMSREELEKLAIDIALDDKNGRALYNGPARTFARATLEGKIQPNKKHLPELAQLQKQLGQQYSNKFSKVSLPIMNKSSNFNIDPYLQLP